MLTIAHYLIGPNGQSEPFNEAGYQIRSGRIIGIQVKNPAIPKMTGYPIVQLSRKAYLIAFHIKVI